VSRTVAQIIDQLVVQVDELARAYSVRVGISSWVDGCGSGALSPAYGTLGFWAYTQR